MWRRIFLVVCPILLLGNAGADVGPRMTDADLFAALNLDYPGLDAVKAALSKNDVPAAKHALAAYFRTREKPVWRQSRRFRRNADRIRQWVEPVMDRTFRVVGVSHRFGAGNDIDWFYNPTGGDSGIEFQREWTWQFNRHSAWSALAMAYEASKDETYAKEFAYEVADWLHDCPRPLSGNVNAIGSAWRTIETGIRMSGSWPTAFYAFRGSASVDDETLLGMVKGFVEHAYHLMPDSRFSPGSNWGTMEGNGLFCVGVLFPEFKESETWRKTAMDRLYGELDRQVYPDGMQIELSSSYHQVSLGNFVEPLDLARLNDVALPQDYLAKLQRMYDYNLYAAMPDGTLPPVNDSGRSNVRRSLAQAAEFFPERTDFLWLATEGKEGVRPAETSHAFPYAGYMVMRSGWDAGDDYLFFDVGPFGYGHQHEDKLSLVTYAYGRQHVVDPGNYRYDDSKWRRHIISTFAHNTVIVDGMGQHRRGARNRWDYVVKEPAPHTWISTPTYDFAAGIYDEGYGDQKDKTVTHRRRVLFVKPSDGIAGYWVVSDLLTPSDRAPHRYEALFHLNASPDSVTADAQTGCVRTGNEGSSNFAIWPVPRKGLSGKVLAGQTEPVLRGWIEGPETVVPLPVASYTFDASGTARAMYILYPIREGEALPIASVASVSVKGDGLAAKVAFSDGRVHEVLVSDQPGKRISFGDFKSDGEAAWAAMDGAGKVVRTILVDGKVFTQKGKPIGN